MSNRKLAYTLLSGKPQKPKKQKKEHKKEHKNRGTWLLDKVCCLGLDALEAYWNKKLWTPYE